MQINFCNPALFDQLVLWCLMVLNFKVFGKNCLSIFFTKCSLLIKIFLCRPISEIEKVLSYGCYFFMYSCVIKHMRLEIGGLTQADRVDPTQRDGT